MTERILTASQPIPPLKLMRTPTKVLDYTYLFAHRGDEKYEWSFGGVNRHPTLTHPCFIKHPASQKLTTISAGSKLDADFTRDHLGTRRIQTPACMSNTRTAPVKRAVLPRMLTRALKDD